MPVVFPNPSISLVPLSEDHLPAIEAMRGVSDIQAQSVFADPERTTLDIIRGGIVAHNAGRRFIFAILKNEECVGLISTYRPTPQGEIGYFVAPDHREQGIVSTAIYLLTERVRKWAEGNCDCRLFATPDFANAASIKALEKNGFEEEVYNPDIKLEPHAKLFVKDVSGGVILPKQVIPL